MRIDNERQVMNLMNTNGRRSDVISAYSIYMEILDEIYKDTTDNFFNSFPKSLNQYKFYKEAITRSPEVFKKHDNYDWIAQKLSDPTFKSAFEEKDIEKIKLLPEGNTFLKKLDNGIEDRARHYTSNLVKIGFVDKHRQITSVGKSFVEGLEIQRGEFESLLPINDINLIFLRQLLKLRVYSRKYDSYYSPMILTLFLLINNDSISVNDLSIVVSMINPSYKIDLKYVVSNIRKLGSKKIEMDYLNNFDNEEAYDVMRNQNIPMEEKIFKKYFKSRKSNKFVPAYYKFYIALVNFIEHRSEDSLKKLFDVYTASRKTINKAFSFGEETFYFDKDKPLDLNKFNKKNDNNLLLNDSNINQNIYMQFSNSKRHDQVKEYSDTLIRLLSVTGVISFENGIVTLKYREVWQEFFKDYDFEKNVFKSTTKSEYYEHENNYNSTFLSNLSIETILNMESKSIEEKINNITKELDVVTSKDVQVMLKSKINDDFKRYIDKKYNKDQINKILPMFSDRSNDSKIQKLMSSQATIPTLFEFIVGIAWYHISDKNYDVFSSFNLTMNADFIPETHAGGGQGDVIAIYDDKVVMLEATLMNKQAQKRGEWEPVLRHAANLTISEYPKKVFTFFVADELDENTINIWRAITKVPLKSSQEVKYNNSVANNVTVMPLKNAELDNFVKNEITEDVILREIESSFNNHEVSFDVDWREKIITRISR